MVYLFAAIGTIHRKRITSVRGLAAALAISRNKAQILTDQTESLGYFATVDGKREILASTRKFTSMESEILDKLSKPLIPPTEFTEGVNARLFALALSICVIQEPNSDITQAFLMEQIAASRKTVDGVMAEMKRLGVLSDNNQMILDLQEVRAGRWPKVREEANVDTQPPIPAAAPPAPPDEATAISQGELATNTYLARLADYLEKYDGDTQSRIQELGTEIAELETAIQQMPAGVEKLNATNDLLEVEEAREVILELHEAENAFVEKAGPYLQSRNIRSAALTAMNVPGRIVDSFSLRN